jgi:hypothetical protein
MLNVHRGLPKRFDELSWGYKCLIVGTFPVWGPIASLLIVVAVVFWLMLIVCGDVYDGVMKLFPEEKK